MTDNDVWTLHDERKLQELERQLINLEIDLAGLNDEAERLVKKIYRTLDLPPTATERDIRRRLHELAEQHHVSVDADTVVKALMWARGRGDDDGQDD